MASKTTTYILTCEFILRHASDYQMFRTIFENRIKDIGTYPNIQIDYIGIEKKLPGVKDG